MKNDELDIVNEILSNEKTPVQRSAVAEKKPKAHWGGDVLEIPKEEKEKAGLPLLSYIVVKQIPTPNCGATVYDPVYWIYGYGEDTMSAVRDCLNSIIEWRKKNMEHVPALIQGWEERLAKYGHPTKKLNNIPTVVKKFSHPIDDYKPSTKPKVQKQQDDDEGSVSDYLEELGL